MEIGENLAYMYVDYGEAYGWDNNLEAAEIALKKALVLLIPLAENIRTIKVCKDRCNWLIQKKPQAR